MHMSSKQDTWDLLRLPMLAIAAMLIIVVPSLLQKKLAYDAGRATLRLLRTQQVRETTQRLVACVRDVEAVALARSYGRNLPLLHERDSSGRKGINLAMRQLTEMTRTYPDHQVLIGRIHSTIDRRIKLAKLLADSKSPERTRVLVDEMIANSAVRDLLRDLQQREARILGERQWDADRQRTAFYALSWSSLVVQILMLATVIWLLQRQIKQRLLAEQGYHKASARASSVLQSVRDPIVLLDAQQRVVMHNPAFAEMYGINGNDASMQPLKQIGGGAWDDRTIHQRLADVLLRGREMWDFEHSQNAADGVPRTMLINARRMPLPDAEEPVVLLTVSDISLQKNAQKSIQELNWQLEGKIKQLSEVNRELEAFSYSVSHDLRAPLRHVAGFSDKLARHLGDAIDDKAHHYIKVISSSAQRMAALIDELLVYSRLGRSALRMQAVDMQTLVEETRAMLDYNAQCEQGTACIEWHITALPVVLGDENMLRQIWMNLLGNAVKYSSKRDLARIEISCQTQQDGSHQFHVRDNGAGFDMAYAGNLFGVFQRLHKASEFPGTGIGLASVRRALARHGGRIWAEGAIEAGASFYFVLPARPDND